MRPHIYITRDAVQGLRSVEDVRQSIRGGHARQLWEDLLSGAEADLDAEVLTPASMFPGRAEDQARHANCDYVVCTAAGRRVLRAALVNLLTGRSEFRDAAMRQMEALFDPSRWPIWRDQAHGHNAADLRTGRLSNDLALAYDWLYPSLSDEQRRFIVDGIDRRGIQPFWRAVEEGAFWTDAMSNWMTCVVGGLGIAGMALGDDHPQSRQLIDYSLGRMGKYLRMYGREGEFNESVAYAGATAAPVAYFLARRYFTGGRDNALAERPFPQACRWIMYLTLPPGRIAAFGDCHVGAKVRANYFAAVASAARDGVLQWFYLQHADNDPDPRQLLWYDETVEPVAPDGRLPLGRAFEAYGACISTRTDWNPRTTHCVVYGKVGREDAHENEDVGQLCIDGFGRPLIVDLCAPDYPADFFGPNRTRYYNASIRGHNVLMIGGREMVHTRQNEQGRICGCEFDDASGGWWLLDASALYEAGAVVRRAVVHLLPGIVAVVDDARLQVPEEISLRWHTANRCEPDAEGRFMVHCDGVGLSARVVALDGAKLTFRRREHEYRPPFDKSRLGEPLEQRRESYIDVTTTGSSCRLLSLFAVFEPDASLDEWRPTGDGWAIRTGEGRCEVSVTGEEMSVRDAESHRGWRVDLSQ